MANDKKQKLIKRADVFAAVIILALALTLMLLKMSERGRIATVTVGGEVVRTIDLDSEKDEVFTLDTDPITTIEVKNGTIGFVDSKCRDHTCENTGFLKSGGDTAACLPAKAVISVGSKKDDSHIDGISF